MIESHHGRDSLDRTIQFGMLRIKSERLTMDLYFLRDCMDEGLMPNFSKCRNPLQRNNRDTFQRLDLNLIRSDLKITRYVVVKMYKTLSKPNLKLSKSPPFCDLPYGSHWMNPPPSKLMELSMLQH